MAETAKTVVEELSATMQGYLAMETEIEYSEFVDYYKKVVEFLQVSFGELDQDQLVKMTAVCQILGLNAVDRSKQKDANYKKFKKMGEKAQFWYDAASYKLHKEFGMSKADLEAAIGVAFEDEDLPEAPEAAATK